MLRVRIDLLGVFGDDLTVVNAARVSMAKESAAFGDRDAKLIRYLARNAHISPFFHPILRFRIAAPIFVARQWYRHTVGLARNEVSRRYVDAEPAFWLPPDGPEGAPLWRGRAPNVKQGSGPPLDMAEARFASEIASYAYRTAENAYRALLDHGVAPEQARAVLPMATETEWIETGSLYAYARIIKLRAEDHAQAETRWLAEEARRLIEPHFPVSLPALLAS